MENDDKIKSTKRKNENTNYTTSPNDTRYT